MFRYKSLNCFIAIVFLFLPISSCDLFQKKPDIKAARKAEITGKIADALSIYTYILLDATPALSLPDYNRSKFLKPEQWRKEVEDYQVWIHTAEQKTDEQFQAALDGVRSCSRDEYAASRLLRMKTEDITNENYQKEWNRIFFAPMAKIDPAHATLSSTAFLKKVSFVKLSSPKSYTYTIQLLSLANKRRIETILYPETDVTFMAVPGDYLLLIRSSVTFESGKLWVSPYTIVPLAVPEKASLITADLMTRVSR